MTVWPAAALFFLQSAGLWEPSVVIGLDGDLAKAARDVAPPGREDADYGEAFRAARARVRRLRSFLESEGRYAADITIAPAEDGRHFEIRVAPGPQFSLDVMGVAYDAPVDAAAEKGMARLANDLDGAPARAADVLAARERMAHLLGESGYPDAAIGEPEITLDRSRQTLEVTFNVRPGARARFGDVVLDGVDRIDADLMGRIRPFTPGVIFKRSELALFRERLNDLAALRAVAVEAGEARDDAEGDADLRDVRVMIEEDPDRTLTLGASFSTTEGPAGVAGLEWRNLFERADVTNLDATVGLIETGLTATTTLPHAGRVDRDLRLVAGVRRQDTDAFERLVGELAAAVRQPLRGAWSIEGGLTLELADENDADEFEGFVGDASLPLAVSFDDREDPLNPLAGGFFSVEARTFVNFGESRATFVRLGLDARRYVPLDDKIVVAGRVRLGSLIGVEIANAPPADRFFAGGGGSVRGFDFQALSPEDGDGAPFGGLSLATLSVETRFDLPGAWGGAVFLDAGAASAGRRPRLGAFEWAAGGGVRYETPVGVLRADLGFPLSTRDRHDGVEFYLGIGQAF